MRRLLGRIVCFFASTHRWVRRIEPTDLHGDSFCSRCGLENQWDLREESARYWAAQRQGAAPKGGE